MHREEGPAQSLSLSDGRVAGVLAGAARVLDGDVLDCLRHGITRFERSPEIEQRLLLVGTMARRQQKGSGARPVQQLHVVSSRRFRHGVSERRQPARALSCGYLLVDVLTRPSKIPMAEKSDKRDHHQQREEKVAPWNKKQRREQQ